MSCIRGWKQTFRIMEYLKNICIPPEQVVSLKLAHCWESCSLEYVYLKELGFSPTIVYLEDKNSIVTHTVVYFLDPSTNKYCWFEWAWGRYRGIHSYSSRDLMLKDISEKFSKANGEVALIKEGHDIIVDKTLQMQYYQTMTTKWVDVQILK